METAPNLGRDPTFVTRRSSLQVGGVGKGAQVCLQDCVLPFTLRRDDGSQVASTFRAPVVQNSGCPALLGLQSLQERRAILDMSTKQLHFAADGPITLVLPPGSETFQLESTQSGHLLLPFAPPGAHQGTQRHHLFRDDVQAEPRQGPEKTPTTASWSARQRQAKCCIRCAGASLVAHCRTC